MLSYFNELISLEVLIWLLPAAFFIHDGEEIATMEKWLRKPTDQPLLSPENRLLNQKKNITIQFTIAVLLLGSVLCLITFLAAEHFRATGHVNTLFSGIVGVVLLDGLKHTSFSLALRTYTSGVITALCIEIPYAAYTLYRFFTAGVLNATTLATGIAVALPLVLGMVWIGLTVGRWVTPYRRQV